MKNNHKPAFEQLASACFDPLYRLAYRYTKDGAAAEEIVGRSLAEAARHMPSAEVKFRKKAERIVRKNCENYIMYSEDIQPRQEFSQKAADNMHLIREKYRRTGYRYKKVVFICSAVILFLLLLWFIPPLIFPPINI